MWLENAEKSKCSGHCWKDFWWPGLEYSQERSLGGEHKVGPVHCLCRVVTFTFQLPCVHVMKWSTLHGRSCAYRKMHILWNNKVVHLGKQYSPSRKQWINTSRVPVYTLFNSGATIVSSLSFISKYLYHLPNISTCCSSVNSVSSCQWTIDKNRYTHHGALTARPRASRLRSWLSISKIWTVWLLGR